MRLFVLSLTVLCVSAFASTELTTKIFSVELSDTKNNILSVADGRVYSLESNKADLLATLKVAAELKTLVKLTIGNDGETIESLSFVGNAEVSDNAFSNWAFESELEKRFSSKNNELERRLSDYIPTNVRTMEKAQELFDSVFQYKEADGYDLNDNCYNRAHFWARMMYIQNKIKSQKVYIFFTEKYRRDNNYKLWYHVAPFVLVGSTEKEIVLDMSFLNGPVSMQAWEEEFADHAKKRCYTGKNLGTYYAKTNTEDCVLVRASMYHYSPTDLEDNGSITDWGCSSLKSVTRSIPGPDKKSWDKVDGFLPANCR